MSAAGQLVRESRIVRATGAEVELVDADHPDCDEFQSDEGGRWVTVCREHSEFVQHDTWKIARQHLGHPEDWCEGCKETAPSHTNSRGGFSKEERERALAARRAKAEEKRKEREAAEARKAAMRDLDGQWSDWVIHSPMISRVYLPAEKEAHGAAQEKRNEAIATARQAKRARRQGEELLRTLPTVKSKKEKKNRERIEGEVEAADQLAVSQEDIARIAGEEMTRLARIAFLRAALQDGWRMTRRGERRAIEKGEERAEIPTDYLAAEDYRVAEGS